MARPPVWLLFLLLSQCVLPCMAMGKRDEHRGGKGSAGPYKSWGGWNQRSQWGYQSDPREVVVRVETDRGNAKKKRRKGDKKRKGRSSSSSTPSDSSSSSSDEKKKSKKSRKRKDKKGKSMSSGCAAPSITSADMEELREFRRKAEVEKVRQEVMQSLHEEHKGVPAIPRTTPMAMTPKTKKCVLAQTKVLSDTGGVVALVTEDIDNWEQVHEQLESHSAPVVKKLLGQLQPDGVAVPRLKSEAVKQVMAFLQEGD